MIRPKVYQVSINGETYLVEAKTQAGGIRDVVAEICKDLSGRAVIDMATGEQLYEAGKSGTPIIGSERYKHGHDPNQLPLSGIPETESQEAA